MRLWIAGSRHMHDVTRFKNRIEKVVLELDKEHDMLIHGCAAGVDEAARLFAVKHEIVHVAAPARWNEHGKAAGPLRNQYIIDHWKPQMLAAFPGPESKGTADAIKRARKAGIKTAVFEY